MYKLFTPFYILFNLYLNISLLGLLLNKKILFLHITLSFSFYQFTRMNMDTLDLNKESLLEVAQEPTIVEEVLEITMPQTEEAPIKKKEVQQNYAELSKAELVEKLRSLLEHTDDDKLKFEVDSIKLQFYKKHKQEQEAKSASPSEDEEATSTPEVDVYEVELKALLNDFKDKRAKQNANAEAIKGKNLEHRQAIVDKIKTFLDKPETIHEHMAEFRKLQQEWREAGTIPASSASHLFKNYNLYVENFYDLLKMNNDLRDYDFKKNLELKTALCVAAEILDKESDAVVAFQKLQLMHEEWAHIGPVEKDLRDELWLRFKNASTLINKKHQGHFEAVKEQEEANLQQKVLICEALDTIDYDSLKTFKDWEEKTEELIKIQQAWKAIGFAPRKMNVKIYERYRTACDTFFAKKSDFYKVIKEELNTNLEKKKALVAQVEALKDDSNWKETTQKMIAIQKEWKAIGSVPRKQSDFVWKQFIAACDYFFEQKEKNFSSLKTVEHENLDKKNELILKIENFKRTEDLSDSVAALKELVAEWNTIGHVPFKEKDKIYKRYREACDKQFEVLNVDAHNRHIDTFKVSKESMEGKDKNHLFRERDKMLRQFEALKSELLTCENNFGFFTSNAKKPSPMILEMQKNIDKLKEEKDLLLKKIQLIEAQLA